MKMSNIRVRDDDVLVHSRGHADSGARFKKVHELICKYGALHVPTILVTEIQDFPDAIDFIEAETKAGRMEPQWHGYTHVDYAKKERYEIHRDIVESQTLFMEMFGVNFTKFYTPWGANADHIKDECDMAGIELIDCSNMIYCSKINHDPSLFKGRDIEIAIHWWEGMGRLETAFKNLGRQERA
jgi:hypothetical protein